MFELATTAVSWKFAMRAACVLALFSAGWVQPPRARAAVTVNLINVADRSGSDSLGRLDLGVVATATNTSLYLPLVMNHWPPIPAVPTLNSIDNSALSNSYLVSWAAADFAEQYALEEAGNSSFANPQVVFQGPDLTWFVPTPGKVPATYYYRLKSLNSWGESGWSNTQTVTIHPMFVGLALHWDSVGYLHLGQSYDVGYHWTLALNTLTDIDTIQAAGQDWYDPNPLSWPGSSWNWYYSPTTGQFKSSSVPNDPAQKWGYSWYLSYGAHFSNGATTTLNGQQFTVTGPHQGYTAFGTATTYWEFVNRDRFLYWDDGGGGWTEYVQPGDAVIRYEAGNLGYLLYASLRRSYYWQGGSTSDTVQYIDNLTSCNICVGSTLGPAGADILMRPLGDSNQNYGHPVTRLAKSMAHPTKP